jgi:LssY C-terminus
MKAQSASKYLAMVPFALGLAIQGVAPSNPSTGAAGDYSFTISTSQPWTDTGVDLQSTDHLAITAASAGCDPRGVSGATGASLPIPNALPGALIAKLQVQGAPVLVGPATDLKVHEVGHLFLGVNASGAPPCAGSFSVKVHLTAQAGNTPGASESAAGAAAPAEKSAASSSQPASQAADLTKKLQAAAQIWMSGQLASGTSSSTGTTSAGNTGNTAVSGNISSTGTAKAAPLLKVSDAPLDSSLRKNLDALPRRVNDEYQNLGDMVNFVLIGSQQQVQSALEAASWHVADTDVGVAALKAVLETYQKKDYLAMPMSRLMLFGRYQDYGYEQAEPIAVVASRHHFRIWKAPFTHNGQAVWVGAGTHDIGFERDQRNGKVTHKIDPAVDGERDNIGSSLQNAGQAKTVSYYLPSNPVRDARNATGGDYHSDGRVLVVFLK